MSAMHHAMKLAREAGVEDPETLSEQLLLLLEGAITLAQVKESPDIALRAKRAAQLLINNSSQTIKQAPGPAS